jgi:hypothetical protein
MKTRCVIILAILILFFSSRSSASGRSVGMAGAYTAASKGTEAVFFNPANLGLSAGSEKTLSLFSVAAGINNNTFRWGDYNRYNGRFLNDEDKGAIINSIPPDGFSMKAEAHISVLGFSWGNYALTFSGKGSSDLLLPKDPIELLLFGNELSETLLIEGADAEACVFWDIGLSYGRSVLKRNEKELFCGGNIKIVRGLIYQKVEKTEGRLLTLETGIEGDGDFAVKSAEGGKGYALDLGFAARYKRAWTFGISFFNLLHQIRWNKDTEKRGYRFKVDSLLAENFDADSLITELSYTQEIDPFVTRMPTLMRIGMANESKKLLWALDLEKGLGEGMGVSKKVKASLGAEYKLLFWLDILGGISIGGEEGITFANGLGFNLGKCRLDLGVSNHKGLWPTKSKGFTLAISSGFSW